MNGLRKAEMRYGTLIGVAAAFAAALFLAQYTLVYVPCFQASSSQLIVLSKTYGGECAQ